MRHQVRSFKLNRNAANRKALLRQLTKQVIVHRGITTSSTKAKFIQPHIDRYIKYAQSATLADRRKLISAIDDTEIVDKLIHDIATGYTTRQSGFSRIVPLKYRRGDNTMIVRFELMPKDPKTSAAADKPSDTKTDKNTTTKKIDTKKATSTKKPTSKKTNPKTSTKKST